MNGTQQAPQGTPGQMPRGSFPGGPGGAGRFGGGAMRYLPGGPVTAIVIIALFVITLIVLAIAFYRLYQKAGMSAALGLLMLVPVVNLGVALYLAFTEWPIAAELARLKLLVASAPPAAAAAPQAAFAAEPGGPAGPSEG